MSYTTFNVLAGSLIALSWFSPIASCGNKSAPSQQGQTQSSPAATATTQQRGDKVAIPNIEGCRRDQTTFYKGKVLSFNRNETSVEITVRTEWDTTEKLTQANPEKSIKFRIKGEPLKEEDWEHIYSLVRDTSRQLIATVWTCKQGDKDEIKIIDWDLPAR